MRYTQVWLLLTYIGIWVHVGKGCRCVFFNMGVFYHPPGDFYPMGCYKIQKMLFIKKCHATRPPMQSIPYHYQPCITSHSYSSNTEY